MAVALIVALSRAGGADCFKLAGARQERAHSLGIVDVAYRQQREASQKERRAGFSHFADCATDFAIQAVKIALGHGTTSSECALGARTARWIAARSSAGSSCCQRANRWPSGRMR